MAKDFVLVGKKMKYAKEDQITVVRVSHEAYNLLVDMANESGLPISKIATQAVLYANEHLKYERKG